MIFRKKIYSTIEDLQIDVDNCLKTYNKTRPHSGKYCYGKTPYQTFLDSIKLPKRKILQIFLTIKKIIWIMKFQTKLIRKITS